MHLHLPEPGDPREGGIFASLDRGMHLRSVALNSPILRFLGVRPL